MPASRRRRAAALAAYLAQFASVAGAKERLNDCMYAGLSHDELLQHHQDYLQALIWAQAATFSDEDIRALDAMSRRYTFHSS
ncbi:hypothetical protein N806_15335 [Rhodococcus sp. P27]|uniref:Uncharacterized protein n=1 Tax=Rhodococcus qingshengii JCM 15477 TaxID=1303681 RepID=A0AB38RNZ8_RHOSG|nr:MULTISPECIES: hypothetical protein [Rhodococcus]ERB52540.1 hypothetical protein N806_15335 [Rhodococcus sp. P27]MDA3635271.1 hypothetical protein [Rhodococcus sp. C-2]UPU46819.1 hypothetical protein M0639_32020 [Rhodococcus qingshengii JCM 15477]